MQLSKTRENPEVAQEIDTKIREKYDLPIDVLSKKEVTTKKESAVKKETE